MTQEAVLKSIQAAQKPEETLEQAVIRLAALSLLQYDLARDLEADKHGIRVGTLDKEVNAVRKVSAEERGITTMIPDTDPWHVPVNGAVLLDEIYQTIKKFIICQDETALAATLWITFTWFIDHVQVAPLAVITAPEKRCGKSQLLDLIGRLSYRPLVASNISPSAIFRVIEAHSPTLLIDEADSFLKENEEARGILNSGHTRTSAYVIRVVGDDHEPKQFSTWGAKAISGIGTLPETLMDRAVLLELRRKLATEQVERLRYADKKLFKRLASMLARYAKDAGAAIEDMRPALPEELNDRAQDNWEPLLAIADHAGSHWPALARAAAKKLSGTEQDTASLTAELLADIQEVFTGDRMSTKELLEKLTHDDEKPWATYNRGKFMSPRQLSNRLKEYGIKSSSIRLGSQTAKGYLRPWFDDAFTRYLSPAASQGEESVTTEQVYNNSMTTRPSGVTDDLQRYGTENASVTDNSLKNNECYGVTHTKEGLADMPEITV